MSDPTAAEVQAWLRREGLTSRVFDAAETAKDLADRIELYATLEQLLARGADGDPTRFDPRWLE